MGGCKGNEVGPRTFAILFIIAAQVLDVLRKPERNSTGVVTCSAGVVEGKFRKSNFRQYAELKSRVEVSNRQQMSSQQKGDTHACRVT